MKRVTTRALLDSLLLEHTTQQSLGQALGVSQAVVSNLLTGKRQPTRRLLAKITELTKQRPVFTPEGDVYWV